MFMFSCNFQALLFLKTASKIKKKILYAAKSKMSLAQRKTKIQKIAKNAEKDKKTTTATTKETSSLCYMMLCHSS